MAGVNIAVHVFALAVTVILLFCILHTREELLDNILKLLEWALRMNALTLIFVIVTWCVDGNAESHFIGYVSAMGGFVSSYFLMMFFSTYIFKMIGTYTEIKKWPVYPVHALCLVFSIGVILLQAENLCFYYDNGIYIRGPFYFVLYVYPLLVLTFQNIVILAKSKSLGLNETLVFLSQGVFSLIALILQYILEDITLIYVATTLSLLVVFVDVHIIQQKKIKEQQKQLTEQGISLMISQIQPHFLYNSLTVIDQLCKTDPEKAREAVSYFSTYLRCNLSSLKNHDLIPFSEERKHIEAFLSMGKLRFGELLNVEYDIKADSFLLPALSVQPLVENAVKYGVGNKETGGTVKVATEEFEDCYTVTVSDDGIGFTEGETSGNGEHIGIKNIRERIETMCGGKLLIESVPGKGTVAKIIIRKGETA